jgi:hypothetical protein
MVFVGDEMETLLIILRNKTWMVKLHQRKNKIGWESKHYKKEINISSSVWRKLENIAPRGCGDIEGMKEKILSENRCTGHYKE